MPVKSKLHVDQLLSNISVRYSNNEFIAHKAFPAVNVKKDSDLYRVYDRNFRIPETSRANGAKAREHYFEVSNSSYVLEKHALVDFVSDSDVENYDVSDLRADTTEELTDAIMRRKEKSFIDLFTKTSWSLTHSLSSALSWNNLTLTANPIADLDTAASVVLANSGQMPNYVILGRDSFVLAKNNSNVLDRVKYTSAEISESMLASLFGVGELLVSNAQLDSAAEGLTSSVAQMWPKHAFLGYKPPRASPKAPSAGYIFEKAKAPVKRWRVEERESEAIEVRKEYAIKIVSSLSGYLVAGVAP